MPTKEFDTIGTIHQVGFMEPMEVAAVRELPDGGKWTYEVKFDGYRCLAGKRSNGVILWSRRGNGFTAFQRSPRHVTSCRPIRS